MLGGTGDELRHSAEEAGQQAVARVREVGARATARAADAAADVIGGAGGQGAGGNGNMDKPSQS